MVDGIDFLVFIIGVAECIRISTYPRDLEAVDRLLLEESCRLGQGEMESRRLDDGNSVSVQKLLKEESQMPKLRVMSL